MTVINIVALCVLFFIAAWFVIGFADYFKYVRYCNESSKKPKDFWHWVIFDEIEKETDALKVEFVRLKPEAKIPSRGSDGAAGYDLYALIKDNGEVKIAPGKNYLFHTGISLAVPEGHFVGIYARSGLATKRGLRPSNCCGIVDEDYRGELMVSLYNDSDVMQTIKNGDRIAQIIFQEYCKVDLVETSELTSTERGKGGFGSTGDK